ncbi:MAG: chorismate synthase [Eubacterium sp.]|nr:chorismate synthase [Eubacterium sp.]
MSSTFGNNIRLSVFGESHSAAVGMTLDGIPAGECIDLDELQKFMDRRAPGRSSRTTARREDDVPEFLSGIMIGADGDASSGRFGVTEGTPITAVIRNRDTRSQDYDLMKCVPRPGHADYPAHVKYGGNEDFRGGGHFSGRLTAPICIAGGIILQILKRRGITVEAKIAEIHGVEIKDEASYQLAMAEIDKAAAEGDSVGGVVSCEIKGLEAGIGEPMFGGVENVISQALFAIPAVKGIEFGRGFDAARIKGSENNDSFVTSGEDGRIVTESNNHGGILGGLTSGMPVTFRAAFKPTPSIAKPQRSVNYETGEETELVIKGRHDPCVVVRAVPVVEAAAAIAVYDLLQE